MYDVKSSGPKTDPCGTPHLRVFGNEQVPLILINWCLDVKYDFNHAKTRSDSPFLARRRSSKIVRSIVSKALYLYHYKFKFIVKHRTNVITNFDKLCISKVLFTIG